MTRNKTLIQFFEWYCPADGNHWSRFQQEAPSLLELGITAAWLPPAYKGTRGPESEGYDVYDIYDLGEFDQKGSVRTKYGDKQAYIDCVNYARQLGLQVYVDVVLNHMGGAEEKETITVKQVDDEDRRIFIGPEKQIEAYTHFLFPGRKGKYSSFDWNKECFTGIDYAADTGETGIFKILNSWGSDWEPLSHDEKGSFDYLILNDIETRNPAVRDELKKWFKWYYETVPFDGVRLDAVKHINPGFFIEWIDFAKTVNPDLFILGEFWLSDDLPVLLHYLETVNDRMSLFDAPLHHNISIASVEKEKYDLRNIFTDSLVAVRPGLAVTFVDNHDTQPLQSLEEFTEQWFKPHGYALILLRKDGYPCVFYPDLYGTRYSGKNKDGIDCEVELPVLDCLRALLQLRKQFAYGEQVDYFDDPHCIGWVRKGDSEIRGSGCAVILSNHTAPMQKTMNVGQQFAGKCFRDFLQHHKTTITINDDGSAVFPVQAASVSVWVIDSEAPSA